VVVGDTDQAVIVECLRLRSSGFRVYHRSPDDFFADLFHSGRGRPWVPADVMAAVITLRALHGLSDSETVFAAAPTFAPRRIRRTDNAPRVLMGADLYQMNPARREPVTPRRRTPV
jgi:hypothetical protein